MAEFLTNGDLAERIRVVCSGQEVHCGVAFWGRGMRNLLFPDGIEHVRIACDISMHATSRVALEELDAPNNPQLFVYDRLHGKTYVSELGAVVCSANASRNGVGSLTLPPQYLEAGVFLLPDESGYKDAKRFVDSLMTTPIDQAQLERAPEFSWELTPRIASASTMRQSLLSRVKAAPEHYSDLTFLIGRAPAWPPGQAESERSRTLKALKTERQGEIAAAISDAKLECLIKEPSAGVFGDGILPRMVEFWLPRKTSKTMFANCDCLRVPRHDRDLIFGRKSSWKSFWKDRGEPMPNEKMSGSEAGIIRGLLGDREWRVLSAYQLADLLPYAEAGI